MGRSAITALPCRKSPIAQDSPKAGVLHYVGSKEGLLTAALDEVYESETEDILTDMVHGVDTTVDVDMWRQNRGSEHTQTVSGAHVSTPECRSGRLRTTLHTSDFANRELHNADTALNIRWRVPEGVDPRRLLNAGFAMMDGVQLRWLRTPGQDLNAMWAECEDTLFPLPMWEGYR